VIPAEKSFAFGAFFLRHVRARLTRTFEEVRVTGLSDARALLSAVPAVVVSNHTSWWDPLVALLVSSELGADGYALMDGRNLVRLPFFARLGAFGVDLQDPADGARALRYSAKLLDRPGRLVWVFPQGRERPVTARPLGFRAGAAGIARAARAPTLPVSLRYEFGATERPVLHVALGEALPTGRDVRALASAQEDAVTAGLDRLEAQLCSGLPDARAAVLLRSQAPGLSVVAERLLSTLTRGQVPAELPSPAALPPAPG